MRADRVDEVYQEFINQQNHYANFANEFYGLVNQVNQRFQELDKDLVKSEKWLSKQQGFYLRNGLFYDNYHHNRVDVDVPLTLSQKLVSIRVKMTCFNSKV